MSGGLTLCRQLRPPSRKEHVNASNIQLFWHFKAVVQVEENNQEGIVEGRQESKDSGSEDDDDIPLVQLMDRGIKVGNFVAVPDGRRWYAAQVKDIKGEVLYLSYMKPTSGMWKWGQEETGTAERSTVAPTGNSLISLKS